MLKFDVNHIFFADDGRGVDNLTVEAHKDAPSRLDARIVIRSVLAKHAVIGNPDRPFGDGFFESGYVLDVLRFDPMDEFCG